MIQDPQLSNLKETRMVRLAGVVDKSKTAKLGYFISVFSFLLILLVMSLTFIVEKVNVVSDGKSSPTVEKELVLPSESSPQPFPSAPPTSEPTKPASSLLNDLSDPFKIKEKVKNYFNVDDNGKPLVKPIEVKGIANPTLITSTLSDSPNSNFSILKKYLDGTIRSSKPILDIYSRPELKGNYEVKKVLIVNSTSLEDIDTLAMFTGISRSLNGFKLVRDGKTTFFQTVSIDMRLELTNKSSNAAKYYSEMVYARIAKYDPDWIITTGEVAFINVGYPAAGAGYKVIAIGCHNKFSFYENSFYIPGAKENLHFIENTDAVSRSLAMIHISKFTPSGIYILANPTSSEHFDTEEQMIMTSIKNSLNNHITKYRILPISNKSSLISTLNELNKNSPGIIVIAMTRMYDDISGKLVHEEELAQVVKKINKTHIEFVDNNILVKNFNIAASCGPDYIKAGITAFDIIKDSVSNNVNQYPTIITIPSLVSLNLFRLAELRIDLYDQMTQPYVDYVYSGVNSANPRIYERR